MAERTLIAKLIEAGLTENEAKIYHANLSLGGATVLALARAAHIKRTTVYAILDALKHKGLVNIELKGLKNLYVAENPEKLLSLLETRREIIARALPDFAALYNLKGSESTIKYYEGLAGIKSVYEKLIRDVSAHENYLVISNMDEWMRLDKKFFTDFTARRAKLPINIRMLFQDTPVAHEFKKFEKNHNARIKILPKKTSLTTNLVVTPQRVVIHQLAAPIVAIVIENKSAIQMHQQLFEIMWDACTSS